MLAFAAWKWQNLCSVWLRCSTKIRASRLHGFERGSSALQRVDRPAPGSSQKGTSFSRASSSAHVSVKTRDPSRKLHFGASQAELFRYDVLSAGRLALHIEQRSIRTRACLKDPCGFDLSTGYQPEAYARPALACFPCSQERFLRLQDCKERRDS